MSSKRKKLSDVENNYLWAATAGKCELCKSDLIFDDISKRVNLGEKAHVIGHGKKGPRREYMKQYGLTEETIDILDNIILLCLKCHKIVDDNKEKYPPEFLYEKKNAHEEWVRSRLNLDNKSIVVIHKTMGHFIDRVMVANQLEAILVDCISYQKQFETLTSEIWQTAKVENAELVKKIVVSKKSFEGTSISLFPLSQIPLLVHLGTLITDTVPVYIYQFDRDNEKWVASAISNETNELQDIGLSTDFKCNNSKILVVKVSVSGNVNTDEIEKIIPTKHYDIFNISIKEPGVNKVLYSEHVKEIKGAFKYEIERLIQHNAYNEIHLFYAGPAGLAVELGRCINSNMWPHVHLYNYKYREDPKYQYAFSV